MAAKKNTASLKNFAGKKAPPFTSKSGKTKAVVRGSSRAAASMSSRAKA